MPELPEVETTVRALQVACVGKTIVAVTVRAVALRHPLDPKLSSQLVGQTLHAIKRRGKYFYWQLDAGFLLCHLGMSGRIHFSAVIKKHDHVTCVFADGTQCTFHDPRRFGCLQWLPDLNHPWLTQLGVEPLTDDIAMLMTVGTRLKRPVKIVLMDQRLVVGIGNIYANEALYQAGIHPLRLASALTEAEWARLIKAVQAVLHAAIAAGGTTLRDFAVDEKLGFFAPSLQVYQRAGAPCAICRHPIERVMQAGRATFFCAECQPASP
jgi:formamidopyrimidine-DNA glycosylase